MRRIGVLVAAIAIVMVGCSSEDGTENSPAPSSPTTSAAPSTTTPQPPPPPPAPPPATEPTYEAPATVEEAEPTIQPVTLGDYCSSRGASAPTADGSTAYCARLAGTDAYVWALTPGVASNPDVPLPGNGTSAPGDVCYDLSATTINSQGQTLYCNPSVDDQGAVNVLRWELTP
ncbi:hypothetical protein [Gordonia rubripertincta]|uniref:LppP/LprE family lipoprotein n=1 Tax=Gordonia rubripertincta TaxID=36822 RepID=A0ABT4MTZ3_GORRU|nr:hypothetical protein [Gordonia rubripertincta]MCZ4549721.1 hypothetical protein [Gordonia rubripertincta]